jgi:hypothetical protein
MTNRPSVRVREDFAATAAEQGHATKTAIAQAIGLDPSNVGRVLRGEARPSNEFIAGALALGPFEDLFEVR